MIFNLALQIHNKSVKTHQIYSILNGCIGKPVSDNIASMFQMTDLYRNFGYVQKKSLVSSPIPSKDYFYDKLNLCVYTM